MTAVLLNGEPADLPPGSTIDGVIGHLGCGKRGIAVAVNAEVVPKSAWSSTRVSGGDQIEVLMAVQGGC